MTLKQRTHKTGTVTTRNHGSASSWNERVNYNKAGEEKLLGTPLTIEALSSGEVSWKLLKKTAEYKKNNGEWTTMTSATTIPVSQGDKVYLRGENIEYCGNTIQSTARFTLSGNIMSLTYKNTFPSELTTNSNNFQSLFSGCTTLISAENLKLPATTLGQYSYSSMFKNCTSLVDSPVLPALTVPAYGYANMFIGCSSLLKAPALPATIMGQYSYYYMFFL